jgi:cysteinyl-tRNA synthetase
MDDDFNTPRALATIITFAKDVEPAANRNLGKQSVELILRTFDYFGGVFGILRPMDAEQRKTFEELVNVVVKIREDARKRGDWETSDSIRDHLRKIGIGLEDTASGARWYLASSKS